MTSKFVETGTEPQYQEITGPQGKGLRRTLRLLRLILQPMGYMEDNVRRYGHVFKIGGDTSTPLVYVGDPNLVQEIFALNSTQVKTGQNNGVLRAMVGDYSILLLDGKAHKRQRKLLMPSFHGDYLRSYRQLICDLTRDISANWQSGQSIVARPPMQKLTLSIMLQAVFGLREGTRFSQIQSLMSLMLDSFAYPITSIFLFFPSLQKDWGRWSPWGRFIYWREQLRELIYDEIRDRREFLAQAGETSEKRTDILTLLIQARDENGEGMSDLELHDELITLLFAGHETTTSALVWILYWIHYLPEVETKIRSELASLGSSPDPEAISQLPYLTAVCQEALRIYPITPTTFPRTLREPMTLAGYSFEAGTALMPATYMIHQREDLYPEPKEFRPERFLENQYAPYQYLPFGGGHRRCIGSALAMMELKLSTATLLQNFQFTLPRSGSIRPARRGLTMAPPASMKIKVKS